MLKSVIAALLLICSFSLYVNADLPVHCLFSQVQGAWEFGLTTDGKTKDVVNVCSLNSSIPIAKKFNVRLTSPDVVRDETGLNIGFWTLIYDQGFEAVFTMQGETQERKFFAFFNYTQSPDGTVVSHCDRTFVGWYHDSGVDPKNWGCFQGRKFAEKNNKVSSVNVQKPLMSQAVANRKFETDHELIAKINAGNYGWTAKAYPQFEKMTNAQVLKLSGRMRNAGTMSAMMSTAQFLKKLKAQATQSTWEHKKIDLPESFDWRNVDGVSYVSPVRNQQSCGSCYAFAAHGMFESRLRIKTNNKDQTILSPQEIVDCDVYSQGCEGGFQYLVAKHGEDFGFVDEKCYQYVGRDGKCAAEKCPKRLFATDYAYVGGFYGGCNAEAMQREIYMNGPVVVGFQVLSDFRYYSGGVYRHTKLSSKQDPQFVEINHAVLAVGWGVDPVQGKYWICKNSWSDSWGLNGYFLIARDEGGYGGEVGIESDAVSARVVGWM